MEFIYDKAIKEVGDDGKFQKKYDWIYNFTLSGLWIVVYMSLLLILAVPEHNCQIPEKPDTLSLDKWKNMHIPKIIDDKGERIFSGCLLYYNGSTNNATKGCSEYEYDTTWYESTVPSDNNWVCKNEKRIADVLSLTKISETVGAVFFGWFGDKYGRRLTYIISLSFIIVGRFISILSNGSYLIFIAGCIVAQCPSFVIVQSIITVSLEMSAPKRRTIANTMRTTALTIGTALMPLFYWWLRSWKTFILITTSSLIPFILMSWNYIESPRWLCVQGRSKECIELLKKIAKHNNKSLSSETEKELMKQKRVETSKLGPLALFSNRTLFFNTVLMMTMWISITINFNVMIMDIVKNQKKESNPFLDFSLQTLAELPANFIGAYLSDAIGRRYTGFISYFITAVIWMIYSLQYYSSHAIFQSWYFGITLFMINRTAMTVTYYVDTVFNMEIYPTLLRQTGMSLGCFFVSIAAAVSPYVVYVGPLIDPRLPTIILVSTSIIGAICSLLLPETLNAKTPETMEDTKSFGRYVYMSLDRKRKSKIETLSP